MPQGAIESNGTLCRACRAAGPVALFVKEGIPHYRCRACRLVFSRPAVNANFQERLDEFEPAYLQYLEEGPEDRANFEALWAHLTRVGMTQRSRLLDVGCGSGKLVRWLRGRSLDASGLEPNGALFARFLAGDPWFSRGTVEDAIGGPFDVITALDVLEHVEDPGTFLAGAASLLRPGGILHLSTPDAGSLLPRVMGRRWHHFNPYHLALFSRRSLDAAAARHGLTTVSFNRRGRLRSIGYIAQYVRDFIPEARWLRLPARLQSVTVPLNVFDTMHVSLRRG